MHYMHWISTNFSSNHRLEEKFITPCKFHRLNVCQLPGIVIIFELFVGTHLTSERAWGEQKIFHHQTVSQWHWQWRYNTLWVLRSTLHRIHPTNILWVMRKSWKIHLHKNLTLNYQQKLAQFSCLANRTWKIHIFGYVESNSLIISVDCIKAFLLTSIFHLGTNRSHVS